jgi:hypothetical protein
MQTSILDICRLYISALHRLKSQPAFGTAIFRQAAQIVPTIRADALWSGTSEADGQEQQDDTGTECPHRHRGADHP